MAERYNVFKCEVCGNIVEVFHGGAGQLVCCGKPMALQSENTVDAAKEKHVPAVEKTANAVNVKVGSVTHPMDAKHYIEWIEVIDGATSHIRYLNPGEAPEASFATTSANVTVRAYCNLHGLWKA